MIADEGQTVVFNHVGLCVTDLARTRRFYEQALDFRYWWELDAPEDAVSTLLDMAKPVGLHSVFLYRDGLVLELLHFGGPKQPEGHRRLMNEPGLAHLSFAVRDLQAAMARVKEHGGTVLEDSNIEAAVMIRDPDGQLVELTSWQFLSDRPPKPE